MSFLVDQEACQKGLNEVLLQAFPLTLQAACNLNSAQKHAKSYSKRRWETFVQKKHHSKRAWASTKETFKAQPGLVIIWSEM